MTVNPLLFESKLIDNLTGPWEYDLGFITSLVFFRITIIRIHPPCFLCLSHPLSTLPVKLEIKQVISDATLEFGTLQIYVSQEIIV